MSAASRIVTVAFAPSASLAVPPMVKPAAASPASTVSSPAMVEMAIVGTLTRSTAVKVPSANWKNSTPVTESVAVAVRNCVGDGQAGRLPATA